MNFFPGVMVKNGKSFGVKIFNALLTLPEQRFPAKIIEKYEDKNLIAGIRPEDLRPEFMFEGEADPETGTPPVFPTEMIQAELELTEMMGADTYLNVKIGDLSAISRIPSSLQYREKKTLGLVPDMSRLFLFDPETEENIAP
jgi:multiple sugar transport system ATP-binding protein